MVRLHVCALLLAVALPALGQPPAPAPTPLFMPGKNRPSISANAAHEPRRLAETAVE